MLEIVKPVATEVEPLSLESRHRCAGMKGDGHDSSLLALCTSKKSRNFEHSSIAPLFDAGRRNSLSKHVGNLGRFGLRVQNVMGRCRSLSARGWDGTRVSAHQGQFMQAGKVEKAGVCFGTSKSVGPITVEVRLNHDTIPALRGVQISFELLNGITLAQAKKLADTLNENVVGVVIVTASADQTKAAAVGEVGAKL
jgi:hypothetical protein